MARNKGLICSKSNGQEAAWSGNNNILVAGNLIELVNHFKGSQILSSPELEIDTSIINYLNFKDIKKDKKPLSEL
ncbi:hypothetical protein [Candidatus Tisiphia endosymbiont of Neophilaenus lineatus]|uniref:hypothetical protein n=1 Tax=Candidatus Tisiphia endosymbiont of Neophilaenus lineatus TaxID=3139336 RepID=UPI0035C9F235